MSDVKKAFLSLTLFALLGLFLVPGFTFWFTGYAEARFSEQLHSALDRGTDSSNSGHTIGDLCESTDPALMGMRNRLCAPTSEIGQFHLARKLSVYLLALGAATLALIAALALLAYFVPRKQVSAFVCGWWTLRAVSAAEIALHGALLVWLSYWLTAFFLHFYAVKLVLIALLLAGAGVIAAITAIFRRTAMNNDVDGEPIDEAQAPQLWSRVRQFSRTLGTEPPQQIIGGIDTNFFVTQTPLRVNEASVTGRTLFVSLPLLRAISREEADAVLAHEMAHFSGGDTAASAELGPKLVAYAHYMEALSANLLTLLAFYVLNLFRAAFELAHSRASREREFRADSQAAALVSAGAISRALVRVAAYANYRHSVERELFEQRATHQGPLQVAQRVAQGLAGFTQTEAFHTSMVDAAVPHPFDSHPPLSQRMQNVGAVIDSGEFSALVATPPDHTWIEYVPEAAAIESRLWQRYEAAFADAHEQSLAVRYEPANDAERAIVLKYFPDVEFALKKELTLRVTHRGIDSPDVSVLWDDAADLRYEEGAFGTSDTLKVAHPGSGKTTELKIALNGNERDRLKGVVGQYWHRHRVMRRLQAESARAENAATQPSQ